MTLQVPFTRRKGLALDAVTEVMQKSQLVRDASRALNEELGIPDREAVPHDARSEYDELLEQKIEELQKKKLDESEQVNELSKRTLGRYVDRASKDRVVRNYNIASDDEHYDQTGKRKRSLKDTATDEKVDSKRERGINKALRKLTRESKSEHLDENLVPGALVKVKSGVPKFGNMVGRIVRNNRNHLMIKFSNGQTHGLYKSQLVHEENQIDELYGKGKLNDIKSKHEAGVSQALETGDRKQLAHHMAKKEKAFKLRAVAGDPRRNSLEMRKKLRKKWKV